MSATNNTFTKSFNQHPSNLRIIGKLRNRAEYMYLESSVKTLCGVTTVTVECVTSHEKRLLEEEFGHL